MNNNFRRILNLSKKTGDKVVVVPENEKEEPFVVVPFSVYEESLDCFDCKCGEDFDYANLSEKEMMDKVNQDLELWRESQMTPEKDEGFDFDNEPYNWIKKRDWDSEPRGIPAFDEFSADKQGECFEEDGDPEPRWIQGKSWLEDLEPESRWVQSRDEEGDYGSWLEDLDDDVPMPASIDAGAGSRPGGVGKEEDDILGEGVEDNWASAGEVLGGDFTTESEDDESFEETEEDLVTDGFLEEIVSLEEEDHEPRWVHGKGDEDDFTAELEDGENFEEIEEESPLTQIFAKPEVPTIDESFDTALEPRRVSTFDESSADKQGGDETVQDDGEEEDESGFATEPEDDEFLVEPIE